MPRKADYGLRIRREGHYPEKKKTILLFVGSVKEFCHSSHVATGKLETKLLSIFFGVSIKLLWQIWLNEGQHTRGKDYEIVKLIFQH